jgi:hypothetical protein
MSWARRGVAVAGTAVVGLALLASQQGGAAATTVTASPLILRAVAASSDPGYRFFQVQGGLPYRWNPCVRLHYRITWNGISSREASNVRAALRLIGSQTGISFTYDGTSRMIPQSSTFPAARAAHTQLLIAFAYPGHGRGRSDVLQGYEVGRGGPESDGSGLYTAGAVVIDKRTWTTYHMGSKDRIVLYMHELGHAMGLSHTSRAGQIMNPGTYPARAAWGAGDRAGLHRLGRAAGCPVAPGPVSSLRAVRPPGGGARVTWARGTNGHLPPGVEYRVSVAGSTGWSTDFTSQQPGNVLLLTKDQVPSSTAAETVTVTVRVRGINAMGGSPWRSVTVP